MIKYSKDWTQVTIRGIRYESFTLAEFIAWVKENVPQGTPDDNILIDFNINACEDYNLYGDTYLSQKADMILSIKKQEES